jgi:hypothetical protein
VLGRADGPSSLAASLSMVAELLEGWVDAVAAYGFRWGIRSALVTALSYFLKLEAELEFLESGRNVALMEDQLELFGSRPQTCWHLTSFLLMSMTLLMVRGSSSGGSSRHCSFAFV